MAKSQLGLILGILLLAAGIAAAIYGINMYNNLQNSVLNAIEKAFAGNTENETLAFIFIGGGAVGAILGAVLLFGKKGKRRRR